MKIFLDTASVEEIKHLNKWGVIEGITTNQKIFLTQKGVDFKEQVLKIVFLAKGPVSVELTKKSFFDQIKEAKTYYQWNPKRIVIKVAMSGDGVGLEVIQALKKLGIKVNATVMMNFNQALLAAKAGASFVSLFYRRITDSGGDPDEEIRKTRYFIDESKLATEIIAGSIREPNDVAHAFNSGAHICTIPYKILTKMPLHPKSEETIKEFDESWQKFIGK